MKTYSISFKFSKDGKSWTGTMLRVKAESDLGAIEQIKSKYTFVKDIQIKSVS